jgi:hypothetical protein
MEHEKGLWLTTNMVLCFPEQPPLAWLSLLLHTCLHFYPISNICAPCPTTQPNRVSCPLGHDTVGEEGAAIGEYWAIEGLYFF